MDILSIIFGLAGGLALFLYGIIIMSQNRATDRNGAKAERDYMANRI